MLVVILYLLVALPRNTWDVRVANQDRAGCEPRAAIRPAQDEYAAPASESLQSAGPSRPVHPRNLCSQMRTLTPTPPNPYLSNCPPTASPPSLGRFLNPSLPGSPIPNIANTRTHAQALKPKARRTDPDLIGITNNEILCNRDCTLGPSSGKSALVMRRQACAARAYAFVIVQLLMSALARGKQRQRQRRRRRRRRRRRQ